MLIGTQISSFLIPATIWAEGCSGRPELPPLALPARDARAIERRAHKRVNLRNETRRYALCCERIQGLVLELSQEVALVPPMLWPAFDAEDESHPSAHAYLAVIEAIRRRLRGSAYLRVAAIFFPPEDARSHLQVFEAFHQHPQLDRIFNEASRNGSLPGSSFHLTTEQCQAALAQRFALLRIVESQKCGLVDVVELF